MSKRAFDVFVIILAALFLTALYYLGLLEKSGKFMLIPLLIFYYLGQYSVKRLMKKEKEKGE